MTSTVDKFVTLTRVWEGLDADEILLLEELKKELFPKPTNRALSKFVSLTFKGLKPLISLLPPAAVHFSY
jgi:hypothetical protein